MAQRTLISSLPRGLLRPCAFCIQHPRLACFLLICVILLLNALSAFAQTSQSVYASVPVTATGATFLYVGFNPANPNANGEIIEYAIVAAAQQIQMDGSSIETPPGLVDCVSDQQNFLYVGLKGGGTNVYTIGQLEAAPGSAGSGRPEVSIAVDPQGRFFFDGWGGTAGFVESAPISRANVGDFKLNNGCTAINGYAANTACTLGLTFTPAATGPRAATLTITDDALNSPQTVAVSGNANPLLTVVPAVGGSFSASIAAGQSATFNLQLTTGFNGSVSFVCSGAHQAATCTVPGITTVMSGTPVAVQITVATTGSSGASRLRDTPRGEPLDVSRLQCLLVLLYFLAAAMLCVIAAQAFRRWREIGTHPRLVWEGVFVPLVALALCTVTGCGGVGTAAQSAPVTQPVVTPPGTSTIIIAITGMTSAGAALPAIAPTQLTLIVN